MENETFGNHGYCKKHKIPLVTSYIRDLFDNIVGESSYCADCKLKMEGMN